MRHSLQRAGPPEAPFATHRYLQQPWPLESPSDEGGTIEAHQTVSRSRDDPDTTSIPILILSFPIPIISLAVMLALDQKHLFTDFDSLIGSHLRWCKVPCARLEGHRPLPTYPTIQCESRYVPYQPIHEAGEAETRGHARQ